MKKERSYVTGIWKGSLFVGDAFIYEISKENGKIYLFTIKDIVEQKLVNNGDFISTPIFGVDDGGKDVMENSLKWGEGVDIHFQ